MNLLWFAAAVRKKRKIGRKKTSKMVSEKFTVWVEMLLGSGAEKGFTDIVDWLIS
jgi:hypothetical protein